MNPKKLSINLASNVIQFAASLVISLFFTPYIVAAVGEAGYGFYAIACTCISYFTVLATAMNSMAARFVTIEYHRGAMDRVKSYYATTFYSNLFIGFLFSLIVLICIRYVDSILNVPPAMLADVKGMFYFVIYAGLFSSVTTIFASTVFCLDRLDIKSIAMIVISLVRVGLLYYLLTFTEVKLIYLGIAYSVSIVLEALVYIATTVRMMPFVTLSLKDFKFSSVRILVGSGVWNSVNQINTILTNGLDLLFANFFVSAAVAGVLGIAKTIPNLLMGLLAMLTSIFLPALTIAYSVNEQTKLKKTFQISFDILGAMMGGVLAGFVTLGEEFFALWMPHIDCRVLYTLSILGLTYLWVIASTQSIGQAALLANRLHLPVLVALAKNMVGIALIWGLSSRFPEHSIYFIAAVSPLSTILFELFFNVPYSSRCINVEKWFFYKNKLKFIANVVILIAIFWFIKTLIMQSVSWMHLGLCVVTCSIVGLLFNVFYFTDKNQRSAILKKLNIA